MHRIGILLALSVPLVMASCQTVPGASRSAQHGEQSRVVVECTVRADGGTIRVAIPFPHCDVPPLDQPASNR